MLESRVLSAEDFPAFAQKVVPFLHISSRVAGEKYPNLLRQKGGNAWPTLSFLSAEGRFLLQMPHPVRSAAELQEGLETVQTWQILSRRVAAAKGEDPKLERDFFNLEMTMGILSFAQASARFDKLKDGMSAKGRKHYARRLVDLQFNEIARTITGKNRTMVAAGEKYLTMIERDRIPKVRQVTTFWQAALAAAEQRKDADLFEKIMNRAKQEMAGDKRVDRYIGMVRRRLERMRAAEKGK